MYWTRQAGDRKINDLKPGTLNLGERLVKNMRIAGSGIYRYHRSEACLFGLDESFLPGDQAFFNIYRPPEVMQRNKDKFSRVPIITGSHVLVTRENAKSLTVGLVGDTVDCEVDDDGELYLYTTGTIISGDGVRAYERYGQLSVGYTPKCEWRRGEHRGVGYDAVLLDFKDVNHLLICEEARGGPQCCVMDSLDQFKYGEKKSMNLLLMVKALMAKGPSSAVVAGDARIPIMLQSIASGADPAVQVPAIKALVDADKAVAGDDKTQFNQLLDLLVQGKGDPEIKEVVPLLMDHYKAMCGDKAKVPASLEPKAPEPPAAPAAPKAPEAPVSISGDMKALMDRMEKMDANIGQLALAMAQVVAGDKKTEPVPPVNTPPAGAAGAAVPNTNDWYTSFVGAKKGAE